jgi:hypothetical protein
MPAIQSFGAIAIIPVRLILNLEFDRVLFGCQINSWFIVCHHIRFIAINLCPPLMYLTN